MSAIDWVGLAFIYATVATYAGAAWYGRYTPEFRKAWPPIAIGRSIWAGLLWPLYAPFFLFVAVGYAAVWIYEAILYPMFYAAFVRDPESKIK